MLRIGVLVSGGGTNLQALLDAIDTGITTNSMIAVVISNNREAYALERAKKHGIPGLCISPREFGSRDLFYQALTETLAEYNLDLIVLAGYLVTIPAKLIQQYPGRIINVHPSLIPAFSGVGYYGLKVHEAALKRGVKITGATVHVVTEEVDAGPILLQKAVAVRADDTPQSLQRRVMEEAEWVILPQAVDLIANGKC